MRDQGCDDLIEYYDYNVNIVDHSKRLSPQLVSGNYRPSRSLVLHLTKADALMRRTQIPTPDDALIFQVLTESLLQLVAKRAPTKKAYFSRSHGTPRGIHTMEVHGQYPWFKLWAKYQTDILDFTKAKKYIVITDIQNFFDSVPHLAVDRALSQLGAEEGLRDVIMFMLENFVERELYAPLVRRGLPQINIDAPRLLAHLLLFPIDEYLNASTSGNIARWVDDINFGVDTKSEARERVRTIENLLARIELRLNGRKTKVLSRQEAEDYLFVNENLKLSGYQRVLSQGLPTIDDIESLLEDFLHFEQKHQRSGHWDQVYRRYIGLITRSATQYRDLATLRALREKVENVFTVAFQEHSDYRMRESLIRYWKTISLSESLVKFVMEQFAEIAKTDDIIAYRLAKLLASATLDEHLQGIIMKFCNSSSIRPGGMAGIATLMCKYGDPTRIEDFIKATVALWSTNDFLARQVICLWSILAPPTEKSIRLKLLIIENVQRGPADLLRYFEALRQTLVPRAGLEGYVSPAKMKTPYTLAKAVVCSNLLRSTALLAAPRERIQSALSKVPDTRLSGIAMNTLYSS